MNDWISNEGNISGELPVTRETLVDVEYRNGKINYHVNAGIQCNTGSMSNNNARDWEISGSSWDIVRWRRHYPVLEKPSDNCVKDALMAKLAIKVANEDWDAADKISVILQRIQNL